MPPLSCFSLDGSTLSPGITAADFTSVVSAGELVKSASLVVFPLLPLDVGGKQDKLPELALTFIQEADSSDSASGDILLSVSPNEWGIFNPAGIDLLDSGGRGGRVLLRCQGGLAGALLVTRSKPLQYLEIDKGPKIVDAGSPGNLFYRALLPTIPRQVPADA